MRVNKWHYHFLQRKGEQNEAATVLNYLKSIFDRNCYLPAKLDLVKVVCNIMRMLGLQKVVLFVYGNTKSQNS